MFDLIGKWFFYDGEEENQELSLSDKLWISFVGLGCLFAVVFILVMRGVMSV